MNVVNELERVLQAEQEHLLNGDFAALEALVARKSHLAERLAAEKPDLPPEVIDGLKQRAIHNEALLNSARRGLQAAMTQLRQIATGGEQNTYTKDGERLSLSQKTVSVIQKI